jgi:hypothetical protein
MYSKKVKGNILTRVKRIGLCVNVYINTELKRLKCVISYNKYCIKQFTGILKKSGKGLKMAYFAFSICHFEVTEH